MARRAILVGAGATLLAACTLLVDLDDIGTGGVIDAGERPETSTPDATSDAAAEAGPTPLGCGQSSEGLVAYFRMDEGSGTLVGDCSGNAISGSLPTAPVGGWNQGVRDAGIELDGSFVELGPNSALNGTGAITVSAWVYRSAWENSARPAVVAKMGGDAARGWELAVTDSTRAFVAAWRVSPDGVEEPDTFGSAVATDTWVHIAGVFEPNVEIRVYVDGVRKGARPVSFGARFDPALPVRIGGRSYAYYWRGLLDEVRIYDRALSDEDVAAIFAAR